ncbi:hypothetical protein CPJCM30710_20500 [Clostridium polyendosporum]|uniref:Uncharacterized protein n=1 Tax=Clostridium polyendosporum TaxID=69208 RepID=A0A919VEP4_9CLOT|nr:hypothetical protein [Clostridium polyendosporum]GIM29384.1 hypothetical protein CPJCM30710_20500 [Clostridium polyendosporum]
MRVLNPQLKAVRKLGIDIKISNGFREFMVSFDKEGLTYADLLSYNVNTKVYSMIRNCCAAIPLTVLETGRSEEEDKEINELIDKILEEIGEEIRKTI